MVISERHANAAYHKSINGREEFKHWGAAQRLTDATHPLRRGTVSNAGGLVPLRYTLSDPRWS
jgi:hypothetical protein